MVMVNGRRRAALREDAMLSVYLVAIGFGGTLMIASLFLGDGEHDVGDGHGHAGGDHGELSAWSVARSLRFWTFVLCFGGAVGALLVALGAGDGAFVGITAGAVGLAAGLAAAWMVKASSRPASSEVVARELAGTSGVVLVAVEPGSVGKIRVEAKGRAVDLLAETDDAVAIPSGTEIMIVAGGDDGRVQVTRAS